jgi:hypothetical protein
MAKIYTKGVWVDEVLAGDARYDIKEDDGTPINETVQIALATAVVQAGTSVDADMMNNIEEGIDGLDDLVSAMNPPVTDAESDMQMGGTGATAGTWIKKTLAQAKTILGIVAATLTGSGIVELATTAEINTGTDTARAMPVDQFVASNRNVRYVVMRFIEAAADWSADASAAVGGAVPLPFAGTIVSIKADSDVAGTTGTAIVDANINGTTIMATNKLKWDSTEKSTATYSGTAAAISSAAVAAGDLFSIDIDTNHTTKSKGLTVTLGIRMT